MVHLMYRLNKPHASIWIRKKCFFSLKKNILKHNNLRKRMPAKFVVIECTLGVGLG
jgi:hypothetical protein